MIVRLVNMTFREDKVEEFILIFSKYQSKIRNAQGCLSLELIQDVNQKNKISTLSRWEDEKYLDIYRESDTFKEVWPLTKVLFMEKTKATSFNIIHP